MKLSGRQTLLLIALVCVLPVVASYVTFYFLRPSNTTNYGQLLEPKQVQPSDLTTVDGKPFALEQLRGKWILVHADSGACGEQCRKLIYYMRQVRTAAGKEMDRVERVWLLTDDRSLDTEWLKDYPGMHVVRAAGSAVLTQLEPQQERTAHIFLIDPLGHLMMRFPADPDPKRMLKDLERLLKVSRVG
jgi:cytochrome oxidase Cu insertion factor (SCO1/SenC/PrrC family)